LVTRRGLRAAAAGNCRPQWRYCGSPRTIRTERSPSSHRSWPALSPSLPPTWPARAFLLEAIARDGLGDEAAAGRALEHALDLAEPDGALLVFLLDPAPGLLERHARPGAAHPALVADILSVLAGQRPAAAAGPQPPVEALSDREIRVLRYLPTNLTAPQIAGELYISPTPVGRASGSPQARRVPRRQVMLADGAGLPRPGSGSGSCASAPG
jgi:hypothetical protein